jgi:chromosome partitioning protein
MKFISFLNIKGGVAKTVSTINVAAELGKQVYSVLIIDLDPQSNATKYLGLYSPNSQGSYELLKDDGRYEIISGERRRYHALKSLDYKQVPR